MCKLIECFPGCRERSISCGNACVDGHVEEHLRDFVRVDANVATTTQMHGQFFTTQRRQNRDRDQASRPPIQVRSGSDGTPCRLRDKALEVGIELGGASLRSLDVLASNYLLADLHSNV